MTPIARLRPRFQAEKRGRQSRGVMVQGGTETSSGRDRIVVPRKYS